MQMTIVKSSTTVSLINDYKFEYRRDGGFNTAVVSFYNTDSNLLSWWDRVVIDGVTWRVATLPTTRVNYGVSPDWLYTVELVEITAILDGVQMPAMTFTQNLNKTRTFLDAITELLLKQPTAIYNTPKYTLHATQGISLSDIAPDDKFEPMSLYRALKHYAEILDARVTLDTNDKIKFEPLHTYTTTISPVLVTVEKTKRTDDYATDLIMDVTNAELGETEVFPSVRVETYLLPLDLTQNIGGLVDAGWDKIKLVLPNKIKRINKITSPQLFDMVYGTRIFEQQEWETLPQSSFWSFIPSPFNAELRENSVYFEYGGTEILNLKALQKNVNDLIYTARDVIIRVEYELLEDLQIQRTSDTTLDGGITYVKRIDQNASTVDYKATARAMENELTNIQTTEYNVSWVSDTIPVITSRVLVNGEYALILLLTAIRTGDKYEINAKLTTNYTPRNPLTRVISENRIFEIPSAQTVLRKIVWQQNAVMYMDIASTPTVSGAWVGFNYGLFLNVRGRDSTDSYFVLEEENVMPVVRWRYRSDGTFVYTAIPLNTTVDGVVAILAFRMISNTSVGYQSFRDTLANATAVSAVVTDENGENERVEMRFVTLSSDKITYIDSVPTEFEFIDTYPFVDGQIWSSGSLPGYSTLQKKVYNISPVIYTAKDRREQLLFENRIKFGGLITTGGASHLVNISKLKRFNYSNVRFILTISGSDYTITPTATILYDGYVRFNFTYPAEIGTGTLTRVVMQMDTNGTTPYVSVLDKTVSISITGNTASYIAVYIKEE